jgi:hypothetical protein
MQTRVQKQKFCRAVLEHLFSFSFTVKHICRSGAISFILQNHAMNIANTRTCNADWWFALQEML